MTFRTRSTTAALGAVAILSLALSGCASPATSEPEQDAGDAAWPRTIEVPAARGAEASSITIESEPQRIAALDYESAEVLAELGLADRLVLIPESVLNPVLGSHIDELSDVEATFPVAMEVEAETVLSHEPELVVMSARHGNEAPIATVLEQAGVVPLQLPESWGSSAALSTNIDLIGQATGSETQAEALADDLDQGFEAEAAQEAAGDTSPSVLLLTNQAGRPFVTAGEAFPVELLERAGARNAADEVGIDRTGAITAEQIVEMDPDGIVLIDMNGTGDRMFTELLSNSAVAATSAVSNEQVLRVEGKDVQALGLTSTIEGLATLRDWVETLDAS